jgi:hypothetical protein
LVGREKKKSIARYLTLFNTSEGMKSAPSMATLLRADQILQQSKGKTSFQRIEGWKDVSIVEADQVFIQALTFETKKKSCGRTNAMLNQIGCTRGQFLRV